MKIKLSKSKILGLSFLFFFLGQTVSGQKKPIDISGIDFKEIDSFVEYHEAQVTGHLIINHHPERITGISVHYGPTMENLSSSVNASFDLLNGFSAILPNLEDGTLYYYIIDISVGSKHIKSGIRYFFTFAQGPVDLDLPSGNMWASHNVGATLPTADGDYFAWGETSAKDHYSWTTYKYCAERTATSTFFSRYTTNHRNHQSKVDNWVELHQEDDAAYSKMGIGWGIPMSKDWKELLDYCVIKRVEVNKVRGILISSRKTPNNYKKTIFLSDQTGMMDGTECRHKSRGLYWSSSLAVYPTSLDDDAFLFEASGYQNGIIPHYSRYLGLNIRAVKRR